jgi:cytochrome P450
VTGDRKSTEKKHRFWLNFKEQLAFLSDFKNDAPHAFVTWHEKKGATFRTLTPLYKITSTIDPIVTDFIFKTAPAKFGKGKFADDLSPLWGRKTLQLSDGDEWRRQKKLCASLFVPAINRNVAATVAARCDVACERIALNFSNGDPFQVYYVLRDALYQGFCDTWFPRLSDAERGEVAAITRRCTDYAAERALRLFNLPITFPTKHSVAYRRCASQAHILAESFIESSRADPNAGVLFTLGRPPTHQEEDVFTTIEARNNFFMFIVACYEWPALGWLLHLLGKHTGVRRRVVDEVRKEMAEGLTVVDSKSPYLMACIYETLRLYPPSPMLARLVLENCEINGVQFRRGDAVVIPVIAIHRNKELYAEPDRFNPERFTSGRPSEAFVPFGNGVRGCVSGALSLSVLKIAAASLLRRVDFSIDPKVPVEFFDVLKSHPSDGVLAKLT